MATLRRLVMSTPGEVLDLGRAVRNYPVHLRQALIAQSRGRCQHAGCDAPAAWLQADHLLPWARDGHSDLENGQTLCRPHNRQKNDRLPHEMPMA